MKKKKEISFDLNLIPFIDMLSVCIFFLMLTAVWIQVGSLEIKQGLGGQTEDNKPTPTILTYINSQSDIELSLKDADAPHKATIKAHNGKPNLKNLKLSVTQLVSKTQNLKTALVMPDQKTSYQDMMSVMDVLRKSQISVGIVPL